MNIEKITEFNHGLIYGFDTEAPFHNYPAFSAEGIMHTVGQFKDVFEAYLFAQNSILPTIKNVGIAKITPEQLLEWLNQLHLRIASTLSKDVDCPAGEFTKIQLFRWHPNNKVCTLLLNYLAGEFETPDGLTRLVEAELLDESVKDNILNALLKSKNKNITSKAALLMLLENLKMDKEVAINFIKIMERIHNDETISIPEDQKKFVSMQSPDAKPIITLHKLASLYHDDKLTLQEKSILEKVVTICTPPKAIPQAMRKFAENLLQAWQNCNKDNLDDITDLATMAFCHVTKIHGYFNGNGRLATCLINIILRSFEKPSILMRYPMERSDPDSSYSQAIKFIDTKPEVLSQHIRNRIKETQIKGAFENKNLLAIVIERVQLCEIVSEIKRLFPDYKINEFLDKTMDKIVNSDVTLSTEEEIILTLQQVTKSCHNLLKELTSKKSKMESKIPDVVVYKYTDDEIKIIKNKLEALTKQKGWISYKTNGLTILLNLDDIQVAKEIVNKLKQTKALNAELKRNPETEKHVVFLNQINLKQLNSIETLIESENLVETSKFKMG